MISFWLYNTIKKIVNSCNRQNTPQSNICRICNQSLNRKPIKRSSTQWNHFGVLSCPNKCCVFKGRDTPSRLLALGQCWAVFSICWLSFSVFCTIGSSWTPPGYFGPIHHVESPPGRRWERELSFANESVHDNISESKQRSQDSSDRRLLNIFNWNQHR